MTLRSIGHRYIPSRTWRERKQTKNREWDLLLDSLKDAYLKFRYGTQDPSPHSPPSDPEADRHEDAETQQRSASPSNMVSGSAADIDMQYEYTFSTINIFTLETSKTIMRPASSVNAAIDIARHGYLAKTPSSPSAGVSFTTLELFHRIRLRKPSLSVEAFTKVLCDYYSIPFRRHLHEVLGNTYEIYVRIQLSRAVLDM